MKIIAIAIIKVEHVTSNLFSDTLLLHFGYLWKFRFLRDRT